jgi:hypothetical protein
MCLLPSCARLFSVCGGCDRGRRYCSGECARTARRVQQRRAGRLYQATDRGRHAHALRQARYRARLAGVTHQPPAEGQNSAGIDVVHREPERATVERLVRHVRSALTASDLRGAGAPRPPSCAVCGLQTTFLRWCFLVDTRSRRRREHSPRRVPARLLLRDDARAPLALVPSDLRAAADLPSRSARPPAADRR